MDKSIKIRVNWLILLILAIVLLTLVGEHFFRKWNQQGTQIEKSPLSNTEVVSTKESTEEVTAQNEQVNAQNDADTESTKWRCKDSGLIGNTTKTSVALLKVHKTGSTTFGSILYRFGIRRGLSFVMPKGKRNYQFWPNTIDKSYTQFYPACKDNKYDILTIHSRYNGRNILTRYMHEDTYVVATLRHPMSQMISSLNFFGLTDRLKRMSKTIEDFFDNPAILTNRNKIVVNMLWNSMSFDIGLEEFNIPKGVTRSVLQSNPKHMKEIERFLNWAEVNIDFFLINEKFDESLILLKDRLGWRIEDMIYFSLNLAANKNDLDRETLVSKTKEFSYIDYLLYERMKEKLDRMIEEKGAELEVEVSELRRLNEEFAEYCLEVVEVDPSLLGANDILSNKLKKDRKDNKCCIDTALDEIYFLTEIKGYMEHFCE